MLHCEGNFQCVSKSQHCLLASQSSLEINGWTPDTVTHIDGAVMTSSSGKQHLSCHTNTTKITLPFIFRARTPINSPILNYSTSQFKFIYLKLFSTFDQKKYTDPESWKEKKNTCWCIENLLSDLWYSPLSHTMELWNSHTFASADMDQSCYYDTFVPDVVLFWLVLHLYRELASLQWLNDILHVV